MAAPNISEEQPEVIDTFHISVPISMYVYLLFDH